MPVRSLRPTGVDLRCKGPRLCAPDLTGVGERSPEPSTVRHGNIPSLINEMGRVRLWLSGSTVKVAVRGLSVLCERQDGSVWGRRSSYDRVLVAGDGGCPRSGAESDGNGMKLCRIW